MNLIFTENQASQGGPGIYGGGIQYCHIKIRDQKWYGYSVLQNLTKDSTDVRNIYASSVALKIRNCNGTHENYIIIRVQRGRVYNISVEVLGEFGIPVNKRVGLIVHYKDEKNSSPIGSQPYDNVNMNGCRKSWIQSIR